MAQPTGKKHVDDLSCVEWFSNLIPGGEQCSDAPKWKKTEYTYEQAKIQIFDAIFFLERQENQYLEFKNVL